LIPVKSAGAVTDHFPIILKREIFEAAQLVNWSNCASAAGSLSARRRFLPAHAQVRVIVPIRRRQSKDAATIGAA
jgi:hypothetical protein